MPKSEQPKHSAILPVETIYRVDQVPNIRTLQQLQDFIEQRQGLFLTTAAYLCSQDQSTLFSNSLINALIRPFITTSKSYTGWERISKNVDGTIEKLHCHSKNIRPSDLFTGSEFCPVLSQLVADAIDCLSQMNNYAFTTSLWNIMTGYNAEDWPEGEKKGIHTLHVILKVTETLTGKSMYYDPTYAQIDHHFAGKIVPVSEQELKTRYQYAHANKLGILPTTKMAEIRFSERLDLLGQERLLAILGMA